MIFTWGGLVSAFWSRDCRAALFIKELRPHLRCDSFTADGGSSTGTGGETEGGVVGPLIGAWVTSSSESSLLSEQESDPESELELALPELGGASPGGLGGLWWSIGLGDRLFVGLNIGGESILCGLCCFIAGGVDGGGLRGLAGDKGPIGDIASGDIGAKGWDDEVIAGSKGNGPAKLQY